MTEKEKEKGKSEPKIPLVNSGNRPARTLGSFRGSSSSPPEVLSFRRIQSRYSARSLFMLGYVEADEGKIVEILKEKKEDHPLSINRKKNMDSTGKGRSAGQNKENKILRTMSGDSNCHFIYHFPPSARISTFFFALRYGVQASWPGGCFLFFFLFVTHMDPCADWLSRPMGNLCYSVLKHELSLWTAECTASHSTSSNMRDGKGGHCKVPAETHCLYADACEYGAKSHDRDPGRTNEPASQPYHPQSRARPRPRAAQPTPVSVRSRPKQGLACHEYD